MIKTHITSLLAGRSLLRWVKSKSSLPKGSTFIFSLFVYFLTCFAAIAQPPITDGDCSRNTLFFNSGTNVTTTISELSETTQGSGTWEAWVKKENWAYNNVDEKLFANEYDYPSENAFYISLHGAAGFHFRTGYTNGDYISTTTTFGFSANSWHHLAATWSESGGTVTTTIYIDGVDAGFITSTSTFDLGSTFYLAGKTGSYKLANGEMVEVRVWDVARTEQEIADNRNSLLVGDETGLVAYWPLNETSGTLTVPNMVNSGVSGAVGYLESNSWREYFPFEIKVSDVVVTNGESHDFGITPPNESTGISTFTITNIGNASLTFSDDPMISLAGTHDDQFTLDLTGTSSSLAVGASTTFSVSFDPTSEGVKEANISIGTILGCSDPYTVNFTGIGSDLDLSIQTVSEVLIYQSNEGQLTANPTGGTEPYSYLWSTGATAATISNLSAGDYSVTVTDAIGATAQSSATITQPDELIASFAIIANVTTIGGNDGQLSASATGGVEPYTYLWNNSETSSSIEDLIAGDYEVTITDANGATSSIATTITQPLPFEANIIVTNPLTTLNSSDGELNAYGRNGEKPYTFLWNTGAVTSTITDLSAGTYTVTITDDEGASDMETFYLSPEGEVRIQYSGSGFHETYDNDGEVEGSIIAQLIGDLFSGDDDVLDEDELSVTSVDGLIAAVDIISRDTIGSKWSYSNKLESLPESIYAIKFVNDKFFGFAYFNNQEYIYVSDNGADWTLVSVPEYYWVSLAYADGLYVAVSGEGYYITSEDGLDWSEEVFLTDCNWSEITFGNGVFVAVASGYSESAVKVSEDGINWSNPTTLINKNWQDVLFVEGRFLAISSNGDIMTSTGGYDWTLENDKIGSEFEGLEDVAFGNGVYVLANVKNDAGEIWSSTDGLSWSKQTTHEDVEWGSVAYGAGYFIAVAEYGYSGVNAMISTDGVQWDTLDIAYDNINGIAFGQGQFIAVVEDDNNNYDDWFLTSKSSSKAVLTFSGNATNHLNSDDIDDIIFNFTDEAFVNISASDVTNAVNASSGIGIDYIKDPSIVYSGSGFTETMANDGEVSGSILITLTGENFSDEDEDGELEIDDQVTVGNIPDGLGASIEIISNHTQGEDWEDATDESISDTWAISAFGNGTFVAIDDYDFIYSTDGETWAEGGLEQSGWKDITYANGLFVAVGDYGYVITSSDAINWDFQEVDGYWYGITYGNGLFVAVGDGETMTSSDGINWTVYEDESYTQWYAVTFGNDVFVAVSTYSEYIMYSSDGADWSFIEGISEDISNGFIDVAFGNGLFVAMNEDNFVYVSEDVATWDSYTIEVGNWKSITFGGNQFIIVGDQGSENTEDPNILRSNDGAVWTGVSSVTGIGLNDVLFASGSYFIFTDDYEHWIYQSPESISEVQLVLSGNATVHQDIDDISDITFEFNNNAFVTIEADYVLYATGPASSGLGIDFEDNLNDDCASAKQLTVYSRGEGDYTDGNTEEANVFEGSLSCEEGSAKDVWYSFTTSSTGAVEINTTLGTATSLSGAVYLSCGSSSVYCVQDLSSKIYLPIGPNTDIYLQLWNSTEDAGTFSVRINEVPNTWTFSGWSAGEAPGATDDALILSTYSTSDGGSLEVNDLELLYEDLLYGGLLGIENADHVIVNGDLINNGGIYVQSGGSLVTYGTITNAEFTEYDFGFKGTAIERTTTFNESTGRYSIVGSPVEDADFSDLGSSALIYAYDESELYNAAGNMGADRFKTPTQLGLRGIEPGEGYFSAFTGDADGKVTFKGTPNYGNIDVDLSYTDHSTNSGDPNENDAEGFNLVSNPYPAAISAFAFLAANSEVDMDQSIYIWDDFGSDTERGTNADYIVVNEFGNTHTNSRNDGEEKFDGYIRSVQGFFVKANSASQTLQFTDAMKVDGNNSDAGYFRTGEVSTYKLIVSNEESKKALIVGFTDDATLGKDKPYDALTFSGGDLQFHSMLVEGTSKLAIQGLPTSYSGEIVLQFASSIEGMYTIQLSNEDKSNYSLWLTDKHTGTITDLTTQSYSFISKTDHVADRFTLSRTSEVLGLEKVKATIYAVNKTLYIQPEKSSLTNYQLYNLQGAKVINVTANGSSKVDLSFLPEGVYLVSDGLKATKIILK
jgi:hypothetical protein